MRRAFRIQATLLLLLLGLEFTTASTSLASIDLPISFRGELATIELAIGTPPRNHTFLFDTGSTDAWVVDVRCAAHTCENNSGYNRTGYDPTASTTHHDLGTYSSIGYLSWTVRGSGTADVFRAAIGRDDVVASWNQTFLAVNDSDATTVPVDGFLGLGFSTGTSQEGMKSLVETMMEQDVLAQPRFGIYYGRTLHGNAGDGNNNDGGVLTVGASREAEFVDGGEDGMHWLPVTAFGGRYISWISGLHSISTNTSNSSDGNGSRSVKITPESPLAAIFDTGSSVTLLPKEHFDVVYAAIGWNGTAVVLGEAEMPCSALNDSWSVSFEVGAPTGGIETRTTLSVRGDEVRNRKTEEGRGEDLCYAPFGTVAEGLLVVGTPILQRLYTVWDYGGMATAEYKPRVGVGRLKEEFAPVSLGR